jgi:hypothetical protein
MASQFFRVFTGDAFSGTAPEFKDKYFTKNSFIN